LKREFALLLSLLLSILLLVTMNSAVQAARCSISKVSYMYPHTAAPGQQIDVTTGVVGSCASDGEDYYAVRVDLIDGNSNLIISSSDTPIGYNASAFNVTAHNAATAPSSNATWPVNIHVYVVRAGGTNGMYLLDYQNSTSITIQVGATPVPEFGLNPGITALAALSAAVLLLKKKLTRKTN